MQIVSGPGLISNPRRRPPAQCDQFPPDLRSPVLSFGQIAEKHSHQGIHRSRSLSRNPPSDLKILLINPQRQIPHTAQTTCITCIVNSHLESQPGSFPAACGALIFAIHRTPKPEGLDCRDTLLRSSAVEGLPRGGNPRVKIFITQFRTKQSSRFKELRNDPFPSPGFSVRKQALPVAPTKSNNSRQC